MNASMAKQILIYSGSCEIVGGDSKYLFDLVNKTNLDRFNISIYTDVNPIFNERARESLKVNVQVHLLDTRPILFKKRVFTLLHTKLGIGNEKAFLSKLFFRLMDTSYHQRKVYQYLDYAIDVLTFRKSRDYLKNALLFYSLFKDKRSEIDVFHFNNGGYPGKYAGLIAILLARFFKIKNIIMTFHNMPGAKRWYRPSGYFFDYFVSRSCSHVIADSEILREKIINERKFPANKVLTIYCGLEDLPLFSQDEKEEKRSALSLDLKMPVLIICGNLDEDRKGHLPLFYALEKVKEKYSNFVLLVVGSGTLNRVSYLSRQASTMGLEDNIRFLGYVKDVHELNSIADIAIVPSLGDEATPYTIKEAQRAGTAVITTSSGGCAEAVENMISGLIIPPDDVAALAEAIILLLDNDDFRKNIGSSGRQTFTSKFLLDEKVAKHEELYLSH